MSNQLRPLADPMVGTIVNSMARLDGGSIHQLTDTQVVETALATPPPGAGIAFPWLKDGPVGHLAPEPIVCPYSAAVQLLLQGADTYQTGAPQRHVMAVRSDEGCFAAVWELSVPRLHHLAQLEAAAALPAAAAPVSASPPVAPAPDTHTPVPDFQAALLARINAYNRGV